MQRLLVLALIVTSLLPYLEWGNQSAFLFEMEYEILFSGKHEKENFIHPAILIPLAGQLLLIIAAFQKIPQRKLVLPGIGLLALLILFISLIGILAKKPEIILSTLPFLTASGWYIFRTRPVKKS